MNSKTCWKIVLIDDESDIRDVTSITLEDAGFSVTTAGDGLAGLELVRNTHPHIVITDIRMPGMDGITLLESVKNIYPDTEVIVVTAFADINLAIRALQLNASDFITKPISDTALHLAVKRAMNRYDSRSRLNEYTALLEAENARTNQELMKLVGFRKKLIDSSMDGIIAVDSGFETVIVNNSFEKLTGFNHVTILTEKKLFDFFSPPQWAQFMETFKGASHGGAGRMFMYETEILNKNGNAVPVQISAVSLDNEKEDNGMVVFLRDLRLIHKLERDLADQAGILHQDKMMSLGRLAASVAHEINNPLTGILNYVRLIKKGFEAKEIIPEKQEKYKKYLSIVETETSRCSDIVSNLLQFSRKTPPVFRNVKISDLLKRSILLSGHKFDLSGIKTHIELSDKLPDIYGDFNQLQQCVINLLFNAADAMENGGNIEIRTMWNNDAKEVMIEISDTGPGVPDHLKIKIFEPFFTTKKEGAGVGLGLSTVYGIMEAHGGRVSVTDSPGTGACFTLVFPVRDT